MDCSYDSTTQAVVVSVLGRVDESSWQAFGDCLAAAIVHAGERERRTLIINLAELDYMSSRGLRVLTIAKRQGEETGVAIILASPNDIMREILAISRYDKLFTITDTVEAAL